MPHDDLDFRLGAHGGDHSERDPPAPAILGLEPTPGHAFEDDREAALVSIAISLKRIADTLAVAQAPVDDWQDCGVVYADDLQSPHDRRRYYGRLAINRRTGEHRVEKMLDHRINLTVGVEHDAMPAPASCLEALGVSRSRW